MKVISYIQEEISGKKKKKKNTFFAYFRCGLQP